MDQNTHFGDDPILYQGQLHWIIFLPALKLAMITLICALGVLMVDFNQILEPLVHLLNQTQMPESFQTVFHYFVLAIGYVPLAVFLYLLYATSVGFFRQYVMRNTTLIYITHHKLFLKTGYLATEQIEVPLAQIESMSVNQDWRGTLFNYGDIVFFGTGGRHPEIYCVADPKAFTQNLSLIQGKTLNQK